LTGIKERVRSHNENILKEVWKKKEPYCGSELALDTLNTRLREAGQKRERYLERVKEKASLPSKRAERVLATLQLQRLEKERVLQESLSQAEKQRQRRLEEASLAAGKHFQQVLERAKQIKEKEKLYAEEKMREYHQRQEAAAEARKKLSESNITNHSLLTSALHQKKETGEESKKDVDRNNMKTPSKRNTGASRMSFEQAVRQLCESGIPDMVPRKLDSDKSLQNSLSELSESLSSMDSGKAPIPMIHQVSGGMEGRESGQPMLFDDFAELIVDPNVIKCVQRIMLEVQFHHDKRFGSSSQQTRYPSRVFLAAYMITNYPEVVLSGVGSQEAKLTDSAIKMTASFEEMIRGCTDGDEVSLTAATVEAFDSLWMLYHDQFRIWKSHDAAGLEADMIKAAVELELSRLIKIYQATEKVRHQVDIEALSQAVDHDLKLIEERISTLTGEAGVVRLKAALQAIQSELQNIEEPVANSSGCISSQSSPVKKIQRKSSDVPVESSGDDTSQHSPANDWDNLSLMWNLLYDPYWRLPTKFLELQWEDAIGKSSLMETGSNDDTQIHLLLTAERNKWKQIENHLMDDTKSDRLFVITTLIAEIIEKLRSFAPTLVSKECSKQFNSYTGLEDCLSPKSISQSSVHWIDVENCLDIIEWCSGLVMQLCAPSRDDDIQQAHGRVSCQMKEALEREDSVSSVTKALLYSIRILNLQTKILSMDLANAHLQALTSRFSRLTPALRISYAREKLGDELGLSEDMFQNEKELDQNLKMNLSRTRGWLAVASGKLPRLSPLNSKLMATSSAAPDVKQQVPKMKTGFDPSQNYQNSKIQSETVPLEKIDSLSSWRGLVRVGLVHIISGDGVIGSLSLPETLRRDLKRLFDLKNEFQRCMVTAICMIIIENSAEDKGKSLQIQKHAAKLRIQAILKDPNVSLKDISVEISSCIQSLNPEVESLEELSSHTLNILKSLLHRSSQEGRGVMEHLNDMLLSFLTIPNVHESYEQSWQDISYHCQRIGAPEIADEMIRLGKQVQTFAAVTEAVCEPWYKHLAREFLEDI
jgi:hypothetical protein